MSQLGSSQSAISNSWVFNNNGIIVPLQGKTQEHSWSNPSLDTYVFNNTVHTWRGLMVSWRCDWCEQRHHCQHVPGMLNTMRCLAYHWTRARDIKNELKTQFRFGKRQHHTWSYLKNIYLLIKKKQTPKGVILDHWIKCSEQENYKSTECSGIEFVQYTAESFIKWGFSRYNLRLCISLYLILTVYFFPYSLVKCRHIFTSPLAYI